MEKNNSYYNRKNMIIIIKNDYPKSRIRKPEMIHKVKKGNYNRKEKKQELREEFKKYYGKLERESLEE